MQSYRYLQSVSFESDSASTASEFKLKRSRWFYFWATLLLEFSRKRKFIKASIQRTEEKEDFTMDEVWTTLHAVEKPFQ